MSESKHLIEKDILKKYIKGKEIKRYGFDYKNKLLLFPYNLYENSYELIPPKILKEMYPNAWEYLKEHEKFLKGRESGKMNNRNNWYAFTYPKSMLDYRNPKIMTPNSAFNSSFSYDEIGEYHVTTGVAGGYCIKLKESYDFNELYLLAILNSSLMTFLNRKIGKAMRGKYYSYEGRIIGNYPIVELSVEEQQPFIDLAQKIIELNKKLAICNTPQEEKLLNIHIKKIEEQINTKVYELYGLNNEEIDIIENCFSK